MLLACGCVEGNAFMGCLGRLWKEDGAALVIAALTFFTLLAMLALAVDAGMLFQAKRKVQVAADAAATAGALDYLYNQSATSARSAAAAASAQNGYTDGSNGVKVTASQPPADGPNAGSGSYFEAQISAPVQTFFMSLMGVPTMTVKARAVAGTPNPGQVCIWVMGTSGATMLLQGSYDIESSSCGIYVNSPSSSAFADIGNGGTVNAKFLDVVGNSTPAHQTTPTAVTANTAPRTSPWGNLIGPNPSTGNGCTSVDSTTTTITGTVPGPGAGNTACYTQAVTLNNATFGAGTLGATIAGDSVTSPAGTLVFGNGVTIGGTVTIYGGTIDVYRGTFSQPSNTIVNAIAPTSGTYDGIAIMQPSTNTNELQVQFGSSNQVLDGYVYAPGAEVYMQDMGGGLTATGIVAGSLYDKASTIRIPSYDQAHTATTINRTVALVE